MMKRENPYTRLKRETRKWIIDNCLRVNRQIMFSLDANETYQVDDIYQRVLAAQQLGCEVVLEAKEDSNTINIRYIKKRPDYSDIPWELR